MKKFLTIALLALMSVNLKAMEKIKVTRSIKGLQQGRYYKILVHKVLGVNTFNDDKKTHQFYAKLYRTKKNGEKGEILSKSLCTDGIWKVLAPSKGIYTAELSYNKKLSPKVSNHLTKKHGRKILSAPKVIQTLKMKITK